MKFQSEKKLSARIVILMIMICAAIVTVALSIPARAFQTITRAILPGNVHSISTIEDSFDGGRSKIIGHRSDTALHFSYLLHSGYIYPYAGVKIHLGPCDTCGIDFSIYDSISFSITSNSDNAIRIYLKSFAPELYSANDPTSFIYTEVEFAPEPDRAFTFSLQDLRSPGWWRVRHESSEKASQQLARVCQIEIMNGHGRTLDDTVHVAVSRIELMGKNRTVLRLFKLSITAVWSAALLVAFIFFLKNASISRKNTIFNHYITKSTPVELLPCELSDASRIMDYMGSNFSNPDLSLEKVARAAGVSPHKISSILQDSAGTTFKSYLNELRINEAKRLLTESTRQITEIALAIGFNNVSHFNRLFKSRFAKSPREYRNSTTQPQTTE